MVRRNDPAAEKIQRADRRRTGRQALILMPPARVRAGDLCLEGDLMDLSPGGAFIATKLLIEIGERGVLEVDGSAITVEVMWLRGCEGGDGPGMGLAFTADEPDRERFVRRFVGA